MPLEDKEVHSIARWCFIFGLVGGAPGGFALGYCVRFFGVF